MLSTKQTLITIHNAYAYLRLYVGWGIEKYNQPNPDIPCSKTEVPIYCSKREQLKKIFLELFPQKNILAPLHQHFCKRVE